MVNSIMLVFEFLLRNKDSSGDLKEYLSIMKVFGFQEETEYESDGLGVLISI
jgi:hypothetical protein